VIVLSSSILKSAGILSPYLISTMSPITRLLASTYPHTPSLNTIAWGDCKSFKAYDFKWNCILRLPSLHLDPAIFRLQHSRSELWKWHMAPPKEGLHEHLHGPRTETQQMRSQRPIIGYVPIRPRITPLPSPKCSPSPLSPNHLARTSLAEPQLPLLTIP